MKSYKEITFRYLKSQKKRTVLTIFGIVLSVALITSIATMIVSMREKMIQKALKDPGNYQVLFADVKGEKVIEAAYNVKVKNTFVTSNVGYGILEKIDKSKIEKNSDRVPDYRYLEVTAYDKNAFKGLNVELKKGRLPQNGSEIVMEDWMLGSLNKKLSIGDKIKLEIGQRIDADSGKPILQNDYPKNEIFKKIGEKEYTIVGLISSTRGWYGGYVTNGITFIDNTNPKLDYNVYVNMNSMKNIRNNAEEIAVKIGMQKKHQVDGRYNYSIGYNDALLRLYAQDGRSSLNRGLVLTLAFILTLIIVCTVAVIYNTFNISVLERIRQFGILRCTGASPQEIRSIVIKEALILSIIGIPIGLLSGVLAMKVVLLAISGLKFEYLEGVHLVISPVVLLITSIIGLITVCISAFIPALQAGKVSPLEAVRSSGSFKVENFNKVKSARLSKLIFGIEGQIANKNLRRNKKRFRITVFSMSISIILFVVFGSFMDYSFKIGAADQKYSYDLSLYSNSSKGIDESIYHHLKSMSEVKSVYKQNEYAIGLQVPSKLLGDSFIKLQNNIEKVQGDDGKEYMKINNNELHDYGDDNLPELKKYLKAGNIDRDEMNKNNGVLIIQTAKVNDNTNKKSSIIDATKYAVGDTVRLCDEGSLKSHLQEVKVMGILERDIDGKNTNEIGGITLISTDEVFSKVVGSSVRNDSIGLILKDSDKKDEIIKYLNGLKENDGSYGYTDFIDVAKHDRDSATVISVFLYGFVAVISLIGFLNIFNTISTNLILRTREISMLKAVGMTRGGIVKMVSLEGIYYGLIASIYGSIIGTVLTRLLEKFMSDIRGFDWYIPWQRILIAAICSVLIALLSSILPLRKIEKGNIIDNIRMEE